MCRQITHDHQKVSTHVIKTQVEKSIRLVPLRTLKLVSSFCLCLPPEPTTILICVQWGKNPSPQLPVMFCLIRKCWSVHMFVPTRLSC